MRRNVVLQEKLLVLKVVFIFCVFHYAILASNPCAANEGRGPCSHMCLINHNRSAACACPHLMKLSLDKKTCYGKFFSWDLAIILNLWTWQINIALEIVSTEHFNDRFKKKDLVFEK